MISMAITSIPKDVPVLCKKCNIRSRASEFKVDPLLGMMVCSKCYGTKPKPVKKDVKNEIRKPAGWDRDDEIVDTLFKEKERAKLKILNREIKFDIIPGTHCIMYGCEKCGYKFKYHAVKNWPNSCPACDKRVPKELYMVV